MQKFWLVWSPTGERPPRFRHSTEAEAEHEAERLAEQMPGAEFFVLEAKLKSRAIRVVSEVLEDPRPRGSIPPAIPLVPSSPSPGGSATWRRPEPETAPSVELSRVETLPGPTSEDDIPF